jgi:protein-S-isoprenylcysteine O-methyltransferase Ste14
VNERAKAWVGTIVFLFVVPGVVAGLVPASIHGGGVRWNVGAWVGVVAIAIGVVFLLHAFVQFAARGIGTPAPIAPTKHLVVTGAYRYVRNPMYLAVLSIIFGQALLFWSVGVAVYGVGVFILVATFVRLYEEPTLKETYGAEYERYCAHVPRWIPSASPYPNSRGA